MLAKHTPGPWTLTTVPTSIGSCHKIGPFPSAGTRPQTFACVYADGIRLGFEENHFVAVELAANARLMTASPELLEAVSVQHEIIDVLLAKLILADRTFRPTQSEIWPAFVAIDAKRLVARVRGES